MQAPENDRRTMQPPPVPADEPERLAALDAAATALASVASRRLTEIPGVAPAQLTPGNNRSAWHLFMMRYDARRFAGLPRAKFLEALSGEGYMDTAPAVFPQ